MNKPPSPMSVTAKQKVFELLQGDPTPKKLNAALHELAKWRARLLENTLIAQDGETVSAGPFKGMIYGIKDAEVSRVTRLIGAYEQNLAPLFEQIIADAPPLIMDIGCGDGYYAVGLARLLPNSIVWARDIDEDALDRCAELAAANFVSDRVKIGGKLTHADFDICRAQNTTILCDIGGGEDSLLDPERAKGLRRADILVEVHESVHPRLTDRLATRFEDTHHISLLDRGFTSDSLPDWMAGMSDLDRLLAVWEWRKAPTPWLWMQRKAA